MFGKVRSGRDAFKFSLLGMRTIAPFAPPTAIADDRLNKIREERLFETQDDQLDVAQELPPVWGRHWLRRRRNAA